MRETVIKMTTFTKWTIELSKTYTSNLCGIKANSTLLDHFNRFLTGTRTMLAFQTWSTASMGTSHAFTIVPDESSCEWPLATHPEITEQPRATLCSRAIRACLSLSDDLDATEIRPSARVHHLLVRLTRQSRLTHPVCRTVQAAQLSPADLLRLVLALQEAGVEVRQAHVRESKLGETHAELTAWSTVPGVHEEIHHLLLAYISAKVITVLADEATTSVTFVVLAAAATAVCLDECSRITANAGDAFDWGSNRGTRCIVHQRCTVVKKLAFSAVKGFQRSCRHAFSKVSWANAVANTGRSARVISYALATERDYRCTGVTVTAVESFLACLW